MFPHYSVCILYETLFLSNDRFAKKPKNTIFHTKVMVVGKTPFAKRVSWTEVLYTANHHHHRPPTSNQSIYTHQNSPANLPRAANPTTTPK